MRVQEVPNAFGSIATLDNGPEAPLGGMRPSGLGRDARINLRPRGHGID